MIVTAALAPDLDLLLRFADGRNHHQAEMHSLGFALAAALAVYPIARLRHWSRPWALALAAGSAWLSHVLLDYLNRDTHPPIGIIALWPSTRGYFKFPWPVFLDIGRTLDWTTVWHDALAAAWEVAVLAPLLLLAWWLRHAREA